jgi:hypothetical protein
LKRRKCISEFLKSENLQIHRFPLESNNKEKYLQQIVFDLFHLEVLAWFQFATTLELGMQESVMAPTFRPHHYNFRFRRPRRRY